MRSNLKMSKVGKRPIIIPEDVSVEVDDNLVKIKGPKSKFEFKIDENFKIEKEDNVLKVIPKRLDKKTKTLWGTIRSLLNNKIIGAKEGFKVSLILEGLGYTAEKLGEKELNFKLGYSHPVKIEIPEGIDVSIEKTKEGFLITCLGADKEIVSQFASKIRSLRPRDAYKLKGFRYPDEVVKIKPVKKSIGK